MGFAARGLLLSGTALLLAAAGAGQPPAARVDTVVDTYFGKKVPDPYRWMESPSPELDSWAKAQNSYTRAVLAGIPGRDALRQHIDDVAAKLTIVTSVTRIGNLAFFKRQDAGADLGKLVMRDLGSGRETVLLDPNTMTDQGHHVSIDQFQPSQDGRYVAVGISPSGSEEDVLRVVDTHTGQMLPDTIDRARFASPSWLPDGQSFFYNRLHLPAANEAPTDRFSNNNVFLHRLGNDPDKDPVVFGPAVHGVAGLAPTDFVSVAALTGARYALGVQSDGVSPEVGLYLAKLPEHGETALAWSKIADAADGIVDVTASRDMLYFRTHQNAPRYRVTAISLEHPDLKSAKELVPAGDPVITNIAAAADGLYVAARNGAASTLFRIGTDGKSTPIKLSVTGSISPPEEGPGDLATDPRVPGAWAGVSTWTTPAVWLTTGSGDTPDTTTNLGLAPADTAQGDYVITETTILARDNKTRLPLSIIEKRGTPHDHQQRVLVEGYGAYGISEEPFARFVPVVRGWVDAGGVLAVAHVRGGGELGEDWHLAGKKSTKQNTIHDFIDSAAAMVKLGYASNATLAGTGTSAGGITIGGAITQSPGLFRAALIRVGVSDALREENTEGGPANIPEFGTVKNKPDFDALYAMDAYQHVKPGTVYPAVMLFAGANDHRVPLWESAKMAARLQAVGKEKGPVLLRVDYEGGHGSIGAGQKQADAELADGFAFLLWQLGVPSYQPH